MAGSAQLGARGCLPPSGNATSLAGARGHVPWAGFVMTTQGPGFKTELMACVSVQVQPEKPA